MPKKSVAPATTRGTARTPSNCNQSHKVLSLALDRVRKPCSFGFSSLPDEGDTFGLFTVVMMVTPLLLLRNTQRMACEATVSAGIPSPLVFCVNEPLACVRLHQLLPEAVRLSKHFNDVRLMGQSV